MQLPTGDVFQEVAGMVIFVPAEPHRLPLVAVTAPGMVGAITALNSRGVAMGGTCCAPPARH